MVAAAAIDHLRRAQVSQPERSPWRPPEESQPATASEGDGNGGGNPVPEPERDTIAIAPIIWTTAICAVIAAGGHAVLWIASSIGWTVPVETPEGARGAAVPWQPVIGMVLVLVAIVAFGGYFIAARRARVAISASFLLTFLVALSYILTLQGLASATQTGGAKDMFNDFRTVVIVIIGFYFGTEALVAGAKIIGAAITRNDPKIVQRMDRDLAPRPTG
jgi:hypothetical protein